MIIARSPLRVTLGGGGTDLPSYYEKFGGFLIAAAIDQYVYITLHENFTPDLIVKYSRAGTGGRGRRKLKHPIIREAFAMLGMDGHGLELTSMADIPAGTGPGFVRQFHHRAAQSPARPQKKPGPSRRTGRAGVRNRTRPAQGAHRQTGSIHRGLRRHHLLQISAGRQSRGVAAETFRRNARQSGGQSAAVFHRLFALRLGDFEGAGPEIEIRTTRP